VRLTESAERLITEYGVMIGNPPDKELVVPGSRNTFSAPGECLNPLLPTGGSGLRQAIRALKKIGVKKVSLPFKGKRSRRRIEHERQSWFRRLQQWRAGQEGTISELKRRYGLDRTLYRGLNGCRRWVDGAIWGYNLNRIARLI